MYSSDSKSTVKLPEPSLRRLPWYLAYIKLLQTKGEEYVSSTQIAKEIGVDSSKIAKDLSFINISGKTRVGYEINSLLAKMCVRDIMQKKVISVNVDATIEEAALLMYKNKIGGMPVVSNVGAVVGVITETDIFKTFVDVMGLADGKTRITLEVTDKIGVVKDIATIFGEEGVSIDSLITCKKDDNKYEIVIRGDITNIDDMKQKLEEKGYKVIHTVKIG